jgi:hypothetical protein
MFGGSIQSYALPPDTVLPVLLSLTGSLLRALQRLSDDEYMVIASCSPPAAIPAHQSVVLN